MACSSIGLDLSITRKDVELFFLEFFVDFSLDSSCSRLFMSYFVGSFQSLGVWQQLSRMSLLSCFLSFGVSTSGSLSSLVLVKLYYLCIFMLILYCLLVDSYLTCSWYTFYHLWMDLFHDVVNL